jgi:broad specificity phosphatase PhoE
MKIHFVRHGESEGNVDRTKYYEKPDCDIALTARGIEQAREAGVKLLNSCVGSNGTIMIHSPYLRAKETADGIDCELIKGGIYSERYENPCIHERMWGSLREKVDGKTHTSEDFRFYHRPIGGESFAEVYVRVGLFFTTTVQPVIDSKRVDNLIIVSHGETIAIAKMILLHRSVEDFERDMCAPMNCEIFTFEI